MSTRRRAPAASTQVAPTASWRSEQLLRGCQEVVIHHAGERYRLRLTRQGKLLLLK